MQEQEEAIQEKDERIADLEARLTKLESLLTNNGNGAVTSISGSLEQNTPNPVTGTTTIRYHLPEANSPARLTLTNAKGQLIRTIPLAGTGVGQVNLATSMFAAGTYTYSLWVNGRQVDSKRLIILR